MAVKEIFLSESEIVEVWGEGFKDLANHPQVKFTQENVIVELKRTPALITNESGEGTKVLKFEEPDVGVLKLMDTAKGDVGKAAALIQGCAGLPAASANKIKSSDFMVISQVVAGFLSTSQAITGTSRET